MKTEQYRAGGFSLVVVVCMIAFVAMAVTATSANFVAAARRTRVCEESSQLRQLLLAGTVAAAQKLDRLDNSSPSFTETIKLPDELASGNASLRIVLEREPADANLRHGNITAALGKSEVRQRVTFELGKTGWIVVDAQLQ